MPALQIIRVATTTTTTTCSQGKVMSNQGTWTPTPDKAHPKARAVLTNLFFWDMTDDNTPFGNDNGADTLAFYRDWQASHPNDKVIDFLRELLQRWDVTDNHWDVLIPESIVELIAEDRISFQLRDDIIIALAFAQILLEGHIEADIKRLAIIALQRQSTQPALDLWTDDCHDERRERLQILNHILLMNWIKDG